jgi:large conductance mechanosensitive channel
MKKVTIFDEFKVFISRGNMADVAIAVIMGTAFTRLVNSFVAHLVSPCVSLVTGHVKLKHLSFTYHGTNFRFGLFLEASLNFLMLTVVVFLIVKTINSLRETVTGQHIVIKNEPFTQKSFVCFLVLHTYLNHLST